MTSTITRPLSRTAARALDKRIRSASAHADSALITLGMLLDEARAGQIHIALGLRSWTEYLETIRLPLMTKDDTRSAIALLSHAGASQRTIASMTGVGLGTVNRRVKRGATATNATVGRDGKSYTRDTPARRSGAAKSSATKKKDIKVNDFWRSPPEKHYVRFEISEEEYWSFQRIAKATGESVAEIALAATRSAMQERADRMALGAEAFNL